MPYKCRFCGKAVKSPWSCNQAGCGKTAGKDRFEEIRGTDGPESTPTPSTPKSTLNVQTLGTLVPKNPRSGISGEVKGTIKSTVQPTSSTVQPKQTVQTKPTVQPKSTVQPTSSSVPSKPTSTVPPKSDPPKTPTGTQKDLSQQKLALVKQIKQILLEIEKVPDSIDSADYTNRIRAAASQPGTSELEGILDECERKSVQVSNALVKELITLLKELKLLTPSSPKLGDFVERVKSATDIGARVQLLAEVKKELEEAKKPKPTITPPNPVKTPTSSTQPKTSTPPTTKPPTTTSSSTKPPTTSPSTGTSSTTKPPTTTTTKPKTKAEATREIQTLKLSELGKKSIDDKVVLLNPIVDEIKRIKLEILDVEAKLETAKEPTKTRLEEQLKELKRIKGIEQKVCNTLFKVTEMDEEFKRNDTRQRQEYLTVLAKNSKLKSASIPENWNKLKNEDKKNLMQFALNEQYKIISPGATPPPIVLKYWPKDEPNQEKVRQAEANKTLPQGYYSPKTHEIIFWVYKEDGKNTKEQGPMRDFKEALDTAIHETSHAYQNELIKQLNEVDSGKRKPPPPKPWELDQAKMFRLNQIAYEDGGIDREAYLKEPLEIHAWLAGGTAAMLFDYDAQVLDLQNQLNKVMGWFPDKKSSLQKQFSNVKGQSANLAEKGPEVMQLLEETKKLTDEIPNVRKKPMEEYDKQIKALELVWTGFKPINLYNPIHGQYSEFRKTYTKLVKSWSECLNDGPLSALQDVIKDLESLLPDVQKLLPLAKAFAACEETFEKFTNAINGFDTDAFTQEQWTEYSTLYDLHTTLKTSKGKLVNASNASGLQSLSKDIQKAVDRASKLPQKV